MYARQAGCPSDFAEVTADFEPWEDGFTFEVAGDAVVKGTHFEDELDGFHAAVAAGMGEELADQGTGTTVAVAVVLRGIGVHLIDSSDRSFRMAGRLAVRDALIRAYGPPPRPKRPRT